MGISESRLNRIVWDNIAKKDPVIVSSGEDFVMTGFPFNAVFKALNDDYPLQYQCEGKYISFKPVSGMAVKGKSTGKSVSYKDGLGTGVSIEVSVNKQHWKKLIKIDSLADVDTSKKTVDFTFLVDTDFDIPEQDVDFPRIRLGENSFIEVSQVWDSSEPVEIYDEEGDVGEILEGNTKVRSFFSSKRGKFYFTKQIPSDFLKTAVFPVWTDLDITYGSVSEFESGTTRSVACCEVDTDKVVVFFTDDADGDDAKAICCTISGTTPTWGTAVKVCDDAHLTAGLGICKLDTDKFFCVYVKDSANDDGFCMVGEVSTRTITMATGDEDEFETGDAEFLSCCQVGTDKAAIVYNDESNSDQGTICIVTVSGTAITSGTPIVFETGKPNAVSCCKLDTDKVMALYVDTEDSYDVKACPFSIVGTVPTADTILSMGEVGSVGDCAQLDTDKAVAIWDSGGISRGAIITASGTTLSKGTIVDTSDGNPKYDLKVVVSDSTTFVSVFADSDDSSHGKSNVSTLSGTTITKGSDEEVLAATMGYGGSAGALDVCLASSGKILIAYRDDDDVSNHGEAIVGDISSGATAYPQSSAVDLGFANSVLYGIGLSSAVEMGLATTVTRPATLDRSVALDLGLATTATSTKGFPRIASVALGLATAVSKSVVANVTSQVTLGLGLTVTKASVLARSAVATLGFATTIQKSLALSAAVALGFVTAVSRSVIASISSQVALGFGLSATKVAVLVRNVAATFGFATTAQRTLASSVTSSVTLGFAVVAGKMYSITASVVMGFFTTINYIEKELRRQIRAGTNRVMSVVGTNRDGSKVGTNRTMSDVGTNREVSSYDENRDLEVW